MAIVLADFKLAYAAGHWADAKWHLSDRLSDWAIRHTPADHINPEKYPVTTIYHYLEHNLPMPMDVRWQVELGLEAQGRTWPNFNQYPLHLQHQLTDHVVDTLQNMFHAVSGAAHEMESSPFHDAHAEPGHHEVPAAHASGEPPAPGVTPPVHYGPPAPGVTPPVHYGPPAPDPQPDARPVFVHHDSQAAGPDSPALPQGQQFHLGVELADDHAPGGPHSGPPVHLVFLGVGLVDEHGYGAPAEADLHHAGPGDGVGPGGDGHPAADVTHFSAHHESADSAYQPDHGGADDPADFDGW
jgi:hypothetical protein